MYSEDSFFTLSTAGQTGLLLLSGVVAAATLYLTWRLTVRQHWSVRILIALSLFFAFEWLSPQIYYTYYIFLLEVPWQIVIQTPPTLSSLGKLLTFADNANLSHHSRGLLGVAMVIVALFNRQPGHPRSQPST